MSKIKRLLSRPFCEHYYCHSKNNQRFYESGFCVKCGKIYDTSCYEILKRTMKPIRDDFFGKLKDKE